MKTNARLRVEHSHEHNVNTHRYILAIKHREQKFPLERSVKSSLHLVIFLSLLQKATKNF